MIYVYRIIYYRNIMEIYFFFKIIFELDFETKQDIIYIYIYVNKINTNKKFITQLIKTFNNTQNIIFYSDWY